MTITAEELLGIIPSDEEEPTTINNLVAAKKIEIDALETRKSKDFYENQREREDAVDYGSE